MDRCLNFLISSVTILNIYTLQSTAIAVDKLETQEFQIKIKAQIFFPDFSYK